MPHDTAPNDEHRVTADPETATDWAREYDVVPVGVPGEEPRVRFVPREEAEREMDRERERLDWDEFHEEFDRSGMALVDRGEGDQGWAYDLLDRSDAAERAALEDESVEEALLEGETVTTEIDETRVVEAEITETETVEHELVEREPLDDRVVDRELIDREVEEIESIDDERLEMTVSDTVSITREAPERLVVESRLVGADVVESDTVTEDQVRARADVAGVQRNVLESDVIASDAEPDRVIERDLLDSDREGEIVTTELVERRVVEEEVVERRDLVLDVVDDERRATESTTTEIVESEVVDRGDLATGEVDRSGESGSAAADSTDSDRPGPRGSDQPETVGAEMADAETSGVESEAGPATDEPRTVPMEADRGKSVVDRAGREIGMVAAVEGDTVRVDPHPSLTDRIKATLNWGDMDEDALPVTPEYVDRIGDEVVLDVERDEEFQSEHS